VDSTPGVVPDNKKGGFGDDRAPRQPLQKTGHRRGGTGTGQHTVGGIEEDQLILGGQVAGRRGRLEIGGRRVTLEHLRLSNHTQRIQILAQQGGSGPMLLGKPTETRPARQGFEPETACPGEQVEHGDGRQPAGHGQHVAKQIEQHRLDAVQDRPSLIARWQFDPSSSPLSRDDPHSDTIPDSTRTLQMGMGQAGGSTPRRGSACRVIEHTLHPIAMERRLAHRRHSPHAWSSDGSPIGNPGPVADTPTEPYNSPTMKFQAVKGTRDFYPEDMAVRNWILQAWRDVSLRNGFEEYDGPIFEYLDLFKAKSGEGIVSELFHFVDRGDRELAIRPEMTPTLARMICAKAQSLPRPIKWFSVPRVCRAEKPQRGRQREFFQWNADIVGVDDVVADAECILVVLDFFRYVGLTPADCVMKINSRSLLAALLTAKGFAPERHADLYVVLDKRDKLPPEAYAEVLDKVTRSAEERSDLETIVQARGESGLRDLATLGRGNEAAEAEVARLRSLFDTLALMGVGDYCTFDMGVVRGLAYYTGVVFEGFGRAGLQRAICGGGRYDHLLQALGGPPMSGLGFGSSDVVILDLLNDLGRLPASAKVTSRLDYFVIDAEMSLFPVVIELTARLRRAGHGAEFSYRRQAIGKQLKQASTRQAAKAVIVGAEYRDRKALVVKNLATGQQSEVPLDGFPP